MLNKPRGCITASRDARRETVFDCLPPDFAERLFAVGRLDRDTEGLLLITDDGKLAAHLLHPEHHVPKTYEFYCTGRMDASAAQLLEDGVYLDKDKTRKSRPATFRKTGECTLSEIAHLLGGRDLTLLKKHPESRVFRAELTVTEGKKHQIKRMMLAVGCRVVWLKRHTLGPLTLDASLAPGEYRPLSDREVSLLHAATHRTAEDSKKDG